MQVLLALWNGLGYALGIYLSSLTIDSTPDTTAKLMWVAGVGVAWGYFSGRRSKA